MKLDENADVLLTIVPTVDTERLVQLMQLHTEHRRPVLLRGPKDSGKIEFSRSCDAKLFVELIIFQEKHLSSIYSHFNA
jgi:hypothetical protein